MSDLNGIFYHLSPSQNYQLYKVDSSQNKSLVVPINVIQSDGTDYEETLIAFFTADLNHASNLTDAYFDTSKTIISQNLKDSLKTYLSNSRQTILEDIKVKNPKILKDLELIIYEKNSSDDYKPIDYISRALKNSNSTRPLMISGIQGYGKTAVISQISEDIKKISDSELTSKYAFSKDDINFLRQFSFYFTPTNMSYSNLMGNLILAQTQKGDVTTKYNTGNLLSAIKNVLFNGRNSTIVLDELLDNPKLMEELKPIIMPNGGHYTFPSTMARDFISVSHKENEIEIKTKDSIIKRTNVVFEIGSDLDGLYCATDEAFNVNESGNLSIDVSKLALFHQTLLLHGLSSEADENKIAEKKTYRDRIVPILQKQKLNQINDGLTTLLISPETYSKIDKAEKIVVKKTSMNSPYKLNPSNFKIFATGNKPQIDDSAIFARFAICMVVNIKYEELLNNIAIKRYGVNSPLFAQLDAVSPDKSASLDTTNAIIKLVKAIIDEQINDNIVSSDYDMSHEHINAKISLDSDTITPREITQIINQSSSFEELIVNFKMNAEKLLGIRNYPTYQEQESVRIFKDLTSTILVSEFSKIAKKYKIETSLKTQKDTLKEQIKTIPKLPDINDLKHEAESYSHKLKM